MPVTIDLSPKAKARLIAEAARRGVTLDQLVAQLAADLPAVSPQPDDGLLDAFFGSGDSGDSTWATRDLQELRHELAQRSSET